MPRILIAGAGEHDRRDIRATLELEGHRVTEADSASQAIAYARTGAFDLVTIDSGMDSSEMYGVCRAIRSESAVGMIVVIREGMEQSRIDALNAGADDYVAARFVFAELPARVRAVMRRAGCTDHGRQRIFLDDCAVDLRSHEIHGPDGRVSRLTPKEASVLSYLIVRADEPVANRELAQAIWNRTDPGDFEFVRTVISQLRRRLERDHRRPRFLITERSAGYRFRMPPREQPAPANETDSQATAR